MVGAALPLNVIASPEPYGSGRGNPIVFGVTIGIASSLCSSQ